MARSRTTRVAVAALVIGGAFVAGCAQQGGAPAVSAGEPRLTVSPVPTTRAELVEAWAAELERAGRDLPEGWRALSTEQIRGRYLHQRLVNAPNADDIDPGMDGPESD